MKTLFVGASQRWALVGLVVSLLAFHFATLLNYPAPSCDETFYSRSAIRYTQALAVGETWPPAGSLFFVPHGRSYWLLLSGVFALFGQSLFTARLVSLLGLAALVMATYLVGRLYVSEITGRWSAALIAVGWLSLYSGHFARPDILAAAANTATLSLLFVATTRRQAWLYVALGLAATLQMDIHLNLLHFLLPITLVALAQIVRDRSGAHFLSLGCGLLIGGVVFAGLHLGGAFEQVATGVGADPGNLLTQYTGFNSENLLAGSLQALFAQWWNYYIWFAPFVSLPQGALFLLGLFNALFSRDRRLLTLLFITAASAISFSVVNQQYQLLGYSMHWLPLYTVLGVAAVVQIGGQITWRLFGLHAGAWALLGLGVLYVVGDVRLASARLGDTYRRDAGVLFDDIPSGARVLTASYWWLDAHDVTTFIDEYQLMPFNSTLWWNGMPELSAEQVEALASGRADGGADFSARIAALKPDYVIDDTVIGCLSTQEQVARALTAYVKQNCVLIKTYNSSFENRLQPVERAQSVYACNAVP